ncbi:substrate-binding domain-containing protein [Belnapia sp. T6]|uniref:Substrate-binding domain-containing protein n=1 Tax=Belnapia mucosa TaxID=2804532 RepID=A0ABS1V3I0_9PROT|nr:substrate-binding domain-containing protein [Belnapia mucosa]MBL6455239.1 substrate-binding domain-containing protein [Belnapia mucosa]
MRFLLRSILALCLCAGSLPAIAAEIHLLSAGAMEPGLEPTVQGFRGATSQAVRIRYATAPALRQDLASGVEVDLLIAPAALIEMLRSSGRLAGQPVPLGRVGVGVAVRPALALPPVTSPEGLRQLVAQSQTVVFNRASTGIYMEGLFERMGLADTVAAKARRYPTGAEVMEHLLRGHGHEIGFGAITEIRQVQALRYLGPLPPGLQSYTTYYGAVLTGAPAATSALLQWLSGPEARGAFDAAGIEPVRR